MNHIFFVAAISTTFWIDSFISKGKASVLKLDENHTYEIKEVEQMLKSITEDKGSIKVYFVSSHRSLLRDYYLSSELQRLGYDSSCQRLDMILLGIDKVKMKSFFNKYAIRTPKWTENNDTIDGSYLMKDRYGTAAEGISYKTNNSREYRGKYLEEYKEGVEYSVNVFRNHNKELTFYPVVWKGETNAKLIPPYKRLRVVGPYKKKFEALVKKLYKVSRKVCNSVDNYGFIELEFIVSNEEVLLLEINPRVSGTLRVSSMACGFNTFDNYLDEKKGAVLKPNKIAIEFPYEGEYKKNDSMGYICTSRATFVGDSIDEIIRNIKCIYKDKSEADYDELNKQIEALICK